MAFAVVCKSCQARFLLNDDLLRRKVAGRVVTVRCRQCHSTIEVDASDVDPKKMAEVERAQTSVAAPAPPPPPAAELKPKLTRPAPSPPRPPAKSTLMGIGAPKPPGATEMVALSPGLLGAASAFPATKLAPEGFPEPPPPPPPSVMEELDADDWEIAETPSVVKVEPAPESVDDFIEELPPSIPPEDELPSSTGTPSLKSLTYHELRGKPRVDDFLANMSAAMNGGLMTGAPTIDVSQLATAPATSADSDTSLSGLDAPREGRKTLPLFALAGEAPAAPRPPAGGPTPPSSAAATSPTAPGRGGTQPLGLSPGSLGPTTQESPPPSSTRPDSPRERRNVVAPATKSIPPAAPDKQRSKLAAPLLLALAAAAGFLIWKRGAAPRNDHAPRAELVAPQAEPAAAAPAPPPADPPASAEPVAAESPAAPGDDMTFETVPAPTVSPAGRDKAPSAQSPTPAPGAAAKPEAPSTAPVAPVAKEEPRPEPREPAAEPSGPFDRAAAVASLTASAAQASACRKEGDPSGVASVVVTFAPSGRVTSANISGPPFAGTPTGGCIAAALRRSRVPAFEGDRVTVSKTVVIQ